MGAQLVCCSVREKNAKPVSVNSTPGFACTVHSVRVEAPTFLGFSPLWEPSRPKKTDVVQPRRVVIASEAECHIHRIVEDISLDQEVGSPRAPMHFLFENQILPQSGERVTSVIFADGLSSQFVAVAFAPIASAAGCEKRQPHVDIWDCSSAASDSSQGTEGFAGLVLELIGHKSPVGRMAVSASCLATADEGGELFLWSKSKSFSMRGNALLHQGGISALSMDKCFIYTVSTGSDCRVGMWSAIDLSPVLDIDLGGDFGPRRLPSIEGEPLRLARLTAVCRPLSRWAASQGSSRGNKAPQGLLFVAGVRPRPDGGDGQGVLMEWKVGAPPVCANARVAHDSPINVLSYGPYDNGPLITADLMGGVRIWEWGLNMECVQYLRHSEGVLQPTAFAVEPRRGLYSIGDGKKLHVWRMREPCREALEQDAETRP